MVDWTAAHWVAAMADLRAGNLAAYLVVQKADASAVHLVASWAGTKVVTTVA